MNYPLPRIELTDIHCYARLLGPGPRFVVRVYNNDNTTRVTLHGVEMEGRDDPDASGKIMRAVYQVEQAKRELLATRVHAD